MTNSITNIVGAGVRTMSSREIAELTEKEHKHVLRDIRVMLEQLNYQGPGLVQFWTDPQSKRDYHEYLLPEDLTITLVSGYSVQMRHRIVKRWQELEVGAAPALPRTFSEALRALADKTDEAERQAAALAIAEPARTCANCCSSADGECMNLVAMPYDPGNRCEFHETEAEFTADVEALKRFRVAIGLPAQRGDR